MPPSTHEPASSYEVSGPARIEPVALCAVLAAATPIFLGSPVTVAFVRPGLAFSFELDYIAVASGLLAITLGGLVLALLRGSRGAGRARLVVAAAVACMAGLVELGFGFGLF